ncbi:hypothetical protein EDC40_108138 [Aminobacter aminovorans]|uniref:Uncharacterized protein n=1 Tax=Aminobacter aminovorans TaxID=83263 RepID=A0A381INI0_AMIAI|nr:hypothetical protein [Aminobacter aminovorans]TCS24599.1 hypothetical protein EDC40_108138 [Aminobacter aminovorans]SUY29465.1 Uncharacterised protein [Aminobacter aminovorans]
MRSTILAFCAVLPTFDMAHAFDIASTFQFPPAGMMSSLHEPFTAPSSRIVKKRTDVYSRVSLGATPGRLTSRRLFSVLPLSATADNGNGSISGHGSIGLSSAASMAVGGPARPGSRHVPCGNPQID